MDANQDCLPLDFFVAGIWLANQGFSIGFATGTQNPELFVSEHWGMTGFSYKVANGKYLTKLYFAETYNGITNEGQRVFTFNVEGICVAKRARYF